MKQWLEGWNNLDFDPDKRRRRPPDHFLLFNMSAASLRRLCGIQRRVATAGARRSEDTGIQRRREEGRSNEIARFVRDGFPWSQLSQANRDSGEYDDLRKPGWLPGAIIVNILNPTDVRSAGTVDTGDLVTVTDAGDGISEISLPDGFDSGWESGSVRPLEIIDGQHRLYAFDEADDDAARFELPVVAFVGLDLSWQAYVFYTVNITPKKINPSLAFDLYPMLRTEDWLTRFSGPLVYRETRAQELTELLWSYPESPWYDRINMLGEGRRGVSQAAWIRSLLATLVKPSAGRGVRSAGGLFGAPVGDDQTALGWVTAQQAAFLIFVWQQLEEAIKAVDTDWSRALRQPAEDRLELDVGDPAFAARESLLATDQGVRGVLYVMNDICFVLADQLELELWGPPDDVGGEVDDDAISRYLDDLKTQPVGALIERLAQTLATFDWRTSASPSLTNEERQFKAAFRGSGGYRQLRMALLDHIADKASGDLEAAARDLRATLT